VILAVGAGSRRAVRRVELGHFAPARWSPVREREPEELPAALKAFDVAIEDGDLGVARAASSDVLLLRALQLSEDARAVISEVSITSDGLAGSPTELLATLLREAAQAIAFQRALSETSRQGR
jgi:hypothetical protein